MHELTAVSPQNPPNPTAHHCPSQRRITYSSSERGTAVGCLRIWVKQTSDEGQIRMAKPYAPPRCLTAQPDHPARPNAAARAAGETLAPGAFAGGAAWAISRATLLGGVCVLPGCPRAAGCQGSPGSTYNCHQKLLFQSKHPQRLILQPSVYSNCI